jgi:hypothetical protein
MIEDQLVKGKGFGVVSLHIKAIRLVQKVICPGLLTKHQVQK